MVRTYEEAVNLMVEWWIEKSFKTPLNQNNGDDSVQGGLAFMLLNLASTTSQNTIDDATIENFRKNLTTLLLNGKNSGRHARTLEVDYHPNKILNDACVFTKINSYCLPIKTFTYIDEDNLICGRYQYGGDWFKI